MPANVLSKLGTGSYTIFVRIRASACHVTVGASAGWSAGGTSTDSGVKLVATTAYTWLKLGRIRRSTAGQFLYRVRGTSIVPPSNTSALQPSAGPTLHLITCYPFYYVGPAPKRLIVRAAIQ